MARKLLGLNSRPPAVNKPNPLRIVPDPPRAGRREGAAGKDRERANRATEPAIRSDVRPCLIGQDLGGYKIQSLLGNGGMGQVYLAQQSGLDMTRVVKVVRGQHRCNDEVLARFRRESQVLSRLHHNHIIQVLDAGESTEGELFMAMEYIEGADLEDIVASRGPMSLRAALCVLRDLADALRYGHARGIVHRDLKPGNVMLRDGDPRQSKLIDFGLVRIVRDPGLTKLTKEDQMIGSPLYMSPEQAQSVEQLTGAVDVYALGGLAYFLLSGEAPFRLRDHGSLIQMVRAHCSVTPTALSERCPEVEIPAFLDKLLLACLDKNPERRPSAEELGLHLERLHAEELQRS